MVEEANEATRNFRGRMRELRGIPPEKNQSEFSKFFCQDFSDFFL
jgi:hypothetical protein